MYGNGSVAPAGSVSFLDITTGNSSLGSATLSKGTSGTNLVRLPDFLQVGQRPVAIATGDFNHGGVEDLVVANSCDNNLAILLGNGDGTFAALTITYYSSSTRLSGRWSAKNRQRETWLN